MEKNQKKILIAVSICAVILAVALCAVTVSKGNLVKALKAEKVELTEQIAALQADYANLTTDSATLREQLEASREECAQLVEKVKVTEATDRAKIRRYENEVKKLRAQLKKYVAEIDALTAANAKLTEERNAARQEAAAAQAEVKNLTAAVEDLAAKVAAGSVLKARAMTAQGANARGRKCVRAKRVVRIVTSLALVENELAPKGPVTVYVRVLDKDGNLVTNGTPVSFTCCCGKTCEASASREVDYEGSEVELSVYLTDIKVAAGIYTVEAYTEKGQLGSVELALR